MSQSHEHTPSARAWKLIALLALAGLMFVLVAAHVDGANGPAYWRWPWRRLDSLRLYLGMALAVSPLLFAQVLWEKGRSRPLALLPLLALSTLAMQLIVVTFETRPPSFEPIVKIVEHPYVTSYFSAAQRVAARNEPGIWLRYLKTYPDRMRSAEMHARGKPPGIILFYYALLNVMPSERSAALAGGLIIALLASLAGPATYCMMRALALARDISFIAATLVALSPAMILIVPQFDQVYPLFTAAMVATWALALEKNRIVYAMLFAATLVLATLLAHHILALGLFLAGYTVYHALTNDRSAAVRRIALHTSIVVVTFVALYAIVWLATGFDPIATFRGALRTVNEMAEWLARRGTARPWTSTVIFDLTDFAMGAGWVVALLAVLGCARPQASRERAIALLTMGQIVALAILALLPTETFRTWIFLLPLLAIPAAMELRSWPFAWRTIVLATLWLMVVVIGQNMVFNDWHQPLVTQSPTTTATSPAPMNR